MQDKGVGFSVYSYESGCVAKGSLVPTGEADHVNREYAGNILNTLDVADKGKSTSGSNCEQSGNVSGISSGVVTGCTVGSYPTIPCFLTHQFEFKGHTSTTAEVLFPCISMF